MGRKNLQLDPELVKNLTALMLEKWEILAAIDVSESAFDRWLKRTFKMGWLDFRRKHATWGKISIMRMAYQQAQQGNWNAINKLGDVYVWPHHRQKFESLNEEPNPVMIEHKTNYDLLSVEELETLDVILTKANKVGIEKLE